MFMGRPSVRSRDWQAHAMAELDQRHVVEPLVLTGSHAARKHPFCCAQLMSDPAVTGVGLLT